MIYGVWAINLPAIPLNMSLIQFTHSIDEDFEIKPSISGWNEKNYDDSRWKTGALR
jgi:hypothetical protein